MSLMIEIYFHKFYFNRAYWGSLQRNEIWRNSWGCEGYCKWCVRGVLFTICWCFRYGRALVTNEYILLIERQILIPTLILFRFCCRYIWGPWSKCKNTEFRWVLRLGHSCCPYCIKSLSRTLSKWSIVQLSLNLVVVPPGVFLGDRL